MDEEDGTKRADIKRNGVGTVGDNSDISVNREEPWMNEYSGK